MKEVESAVPHISGFAKPAKLKKEKYKDKKDSKDNSITKQRNILEDSLIINEAAVENDDEKSSVTYHEDKHLSVVKPLSK